MTLRVPFVVGLSPWGQHPRIEHARGPDGVGCPIIPCGRLREWMTENVIQRADAGALEGYEVNP